MNLASKKAVFSLAKEGNIMLSTNFSVKEFACKDGSDMIMIMPSLVEILQQIRDHFGKSITIVSGYRTESYNLKCGGVKSSQHLLGTAADISIKGVDPLEIAKYAQSLLIQCGGIGYYKGRFCHVDVRTKPARWQSEKSNSANVSVKGF